MTERIPGLRLTYWAVHSTTDEIDARNTYAEKFGRFPAELIRSGPVLLLGPIVEVDADKIIRHLGIPDTKPKRVARQMSIFECSSESSWG